MVSSLTLPTASEVTSQHLRGLTLSPGSQSKRLVLDPLPRRFSGGAGNSALEASHEIGLTLERPCPGVGSEAPNLESIRVLPHETVKDVRLKLYSRPWFGNNVSMVVGGRELLEHEVVGQLARDDGMLAQPGLLHLFVKLKDVASVEVSTDKAKGRTFSRESSFSFRNGDMPRSALTSSLEEADADAGSNSLKLRGLVVDGHSALDKAVAKLERERPDDGAVVHLVVRRDAKVAWQATGDNQFELSITTTDTAESVKRKIEAVNGLPADSHKLVYNGHVLSSSKSLSEYGIQQGAVLELVPVPSLSSQSSWGSQSLPRELPQGSPPLSSPEHELFEDFMKARAGLATGHKPKLAPSGTGGSYFICDEEGHNVAVFKPEDEEPNAVNNPKGRGGNHDSEGLRHGVMPGEGAIREVAAFVLDHGHFAGVPPTAMVSCKPAEDGDGYSAHGPKVGSLQQFVEAEGDCEERGCSAFPVEQVHKICVLDIRLANTDRNGGNILVRRSTSGSWELIPIDHGYCLPSTFEDICFEWLYWPQARVPFSDATREYIANLSWERDLAVLAANGLQLRPECERVLKACTLLLQKAAARGLSPFDVGNIMCREAFDESPLEKMHAEALDNATLEARLTRASAGMARTTGAPSEDLYIKHLSRAIDNYLDDEEALFDEFH